MDVKPIANHSVALGDGAGIQSTQLMAEHDVKVVLTGNCGPNAFQSLNAAGIEVIVGISGKVRDVVEQLKSGSLSSIQAPNAVTHFGMGVGAVPASKNVAQSQGQQMGMGRGIGRCRGMGRGTGRGIYIGQDIPSTGAQFRQDSVGQEKRAGGVVPTTEQGLDALKVRAQAVKQQLQTINERIAQIERDSPSYRLIAVVNTRKCTACSLCEGVCPVAAIQIDTIALIDRAKCTGCGKCVKECPQKAITLKKA